MSIGFSFSKTSPKSVDTLVLTLDGDRKLGPTAQKIDQDMGGYIEEILTRSDSFTGARGQVLVLHPSHEKTGGKNKVAYKQVVLLGFGTLLDGDEEKTGTDLYKKNMEIEEIGAKLYSALKSTGAQNIFIVPEGGNVQDLSLHLMAGVRLSAYKFERYKSDKHISEADKVKKTSKKDKKTLSSITFAVSSSKSLQGRADALNAEIDGVVLARDLGNEPPNALYPESFAAMIKKELGSLGVKITIFDEKKLEKMGAGGILAVGRASAKPPRLVIMEWTGDSSAKKNKKDSQYPLALIGKGITFDTGGISLKPGAGMDEMKMDMCGAGAVVGAMKAIAARKAPVNVVAAVALAENMPASNAYLPGDVVTSLSGRTVEVFNTDAEGRMVLMDALSYIQDKYQPKRIIDLATLTGAMMVALGSAYAGIFANDDDLWDSIAEAGIQSGEKVWRMPLDKAYRKEMESDLADLRNLGKTRYAGACTAAGFLEKFIEGDTAWSHMDIAGVAWGNLGKATYPTKGATGYGVRLLNRLVEAG